MPYIAGRHLQLVVMPRVELADTISQRHLGARLGRATREEHELADLAMDVRDVIASLPPELCELAERLKTDSLSQIARGTGHLPVRCIYRSVIMVVLGDTCSGKCKGQCTEEWRINKWTFGYCTICCKRWDYQARYGERFSGNKGLRLLKLK